MAKLEKTISGDFRSILTKIENGILNGSVTASLEDSSDFRSGDARCSVRVFERYSYMGSRGDAVKIGTAAPPPGLSVTEGRETVERLSLRRGELLVLQSDGAGGEDALRAALEATDLPPGELAAQILACSRGKQTDDATVAVVRLNSLGAST